jgi:broad specificity phosphatase PhoE
MSMPTDLVLVRHGESEGNVTVTNGKAGDLSGYTEEFTSTPGHLWRLTDLGRDQAAAIGGWLAAEFAARPRAGKRKGSDLVTFDRHFVSPYVRTRETAGTLDLPGATWRINRALRERDWGDIGSLTRQEFRSRPEYLLNARIKRNDPLYWVAPNGESVAQVAEDRVRNLLGTLHRECDGQRVLAVTHGDWMWAARLVLERWSDEEFAARDIDPEQQIANCQVLHYTRTDPVTGEAAEKLSWLRTAAPVRAGGGWTVAVSPWQEIGRPPLTNAELLAGVATVPRFTVPVTTAP